MLEDEGAGNFTAAEVAQIELISGLSAALDWAERPLLALTELMRAQARVTAAFAAMAEHVSPGV